MSFTYGSVMFFLLVLTIGAFLLGVIFCGKLKVIRYLFWSVGAIILLLTCGTVIKHSLHNKEEAKMVSGLYTMDLQKSLYHKNILTKYSDLTLTVSEDYTFTFNRVTPLFPSNSGKWKYENDGDISFVECTFDNNNKTFQIPDGIGQWTFQSYSLTTGDNNDQIVFTRPDK